MNMRVLRCSDTLKNGRLVRLAGIEPQTSEPSQTRMEQGLAEDCGPQCGTPLWNSLWNSCAAALGARICLPIQFAPLGVYTPIPSSVFV